MSENQSSRQESQNLSNWAQIVQESRDGKSDAEWALRWARVESARYATPVLPNAARIAGRLVCPPRTDASANTGINVDDDAQTLEMLKRVFGRN